jgi:two-component system copper resistance phosphate regulon response regulator CusR
MQTEINILVVEDEKTITDALQQGLSESGYEVMVAYDGVTGEKMFHKMHFDLVILDINLPGVNGLELCKRFRQRNGSVAIMMLTTFDSVPDKIEGFNAGADDYLVKPFSFNELVVRVGALLRRAGNENIPQGNLLRLGGLEMNLDTKAVTRSGKDIRLTAREFRLLEYLLRNRNRVVSRADIGLNVWDQDFGSGTNTIDVYVNYLRNKIDKDFPDKLIHTQVGFGYMMKENHRK